MREFIRSIACSICRAFGGGSEQIPISVEGSSSRTSNHTPSLDYLQGRMPTYNVPDLIEHLEYRISIHETYWGLVEDNPSTWSAYGSAEYHQWAIEGYANAIWYLQSITMQFSL